MNRSEAHRVRVVGDRGPWLILGHGLGCTPADWAPVVEAFADEYRVLTFAMAGSAQADPALFSPVRHSTPFGFADDISMLCGELGIRGGYFVGHSFAANAAAVASVGDPGLFAKLVLINGSPCYTDDDADGFRSGFSAQELQAVFDAMQVDYDTWAGGFGPLVMANPEQPELSTQFVTCLRQLDRAVALASFRAAMSADFRRIYPRITVPTLLLQSAEDPAVPMSVAQWMADAIPASRLLALHSTGHFPHIVDAAEVIAAIRPFLAAPSPDIPGSGR